MPSSTYFILNDAVREILKMKPKSVLDVGIGFGKYGFLCREYLECWNDRVFPEQWQTKIVGIEIFEPYTKLAHNQVIYDKIYAQPAGEIIPEIFDYENFDLVICMDVIEHLKKEDGIFLGQDMINGAQKGVIINVPTGNWLHNVVVANNPAEEHQAIWEESDLDALAEKCNVKLDKYPWKQGSRGGCMGVFKK